MARDDNSVIKQVFAGSAGVDDAVEPTSIMATGWPATYEDPASGLFPEREFFNWLYRGVYALGKELNSRGLLEWNALCDYVHPAICMGSDGKIYQSLRSSGPAGAGAKNPVGSTGYWSPFGLLKDLFGVSTVSAVGSGLAIPAMGTPAIAALNSTDVAFVDSSNGQLRMYRWSGSAWSLVGSGLAIPAMGAPAIAALNSTDVAFVDSGNKHLRTYRWSGSAWSLLGSVLSISAMGAPAIAALNSADVAFVDSSNGQLRMYRWSGSAWSLVGSALSTSGTGTVAPGIAALTGNTIALVDADGGNNRLRTCRWSGSAWSLWGSALSIPGASTTAPGIAALTANDILVAIDTTSKVSRFRWSGSAWAWVGPDTPISMSSPAVTVIGPATIALVDPYTCAVQTYALGVTLPAAPPSPAFS